MEITDDNYERLPSVVAAVASNRIVLVNRTSVRIALVMPPLLAALQQGKQITVRHVPRCLLASHQARLADEPAADRVCVYEGSCADAGLCGGLPIEYVQRWGWEEELLQPSRVGKLPGRGGGDEYWSWARDDESKASSERMRALARLLKRLPFVDSPPVRRFLRAISAALGQGLLRPELIEPSWSFGERTFRVHANVVAPHPRAAIVLELMKSLGIEETAFVGEWLTVAHRELFVGVAADEISARAKLYFRGPGEPRSSFDEIMRAYGGSSPGIEDQPQMLGVDFVGGVRGFKRYEVISRSTAEAEYGSGTLLSVVKGERTMYRCRRLDRSGVLLNESLHVQTEDLPGIDLAYARALGRPVDELDRLHAEAPLVVRALSETRGEAGERHVYFALR